MVTIIRNTKVNLAKTKNTNIPYFFLNKITRNSKILWKEFLNILIMNSMTDASFLSMVLIDMVLCSRKCSKKVFFWVTFLQHQEELHGVSNLLPGLPANWKRDFLLLNHQSSWTPTHCIKTAEYLANCTIRNCQKPT